MDKLLNQFVEYHNAGNLWIGFLMLGVFYILKKKPFKIFTYFTDKKTKDISQAHALLESNKLSKDIDELLQEYIEWELFVKYYGISAAKQMRSALLGFYSKNQKKVGWHDLRRAYTYIYLDGTNVKVNIKWWQCPMRWVVTFISWSISLYAFVFLVGGVLKMTANPLHFYGLSIMAFFLLVLAMLFSSLNWPYHSARKISEGQN